MFENLPRKHRPQTYATAPLETRAVCTSCTMAQPQWPRDAQDPGPFDPSLKCCTYQPFLANFSIARLMDEPQFRANLERAQATSRLAPLGLLPQTPETADFGRNLAGRCPFLTADARCSIWSERPSVCRSYFCVSDRGSPGQAYWGEMKALGNAAEWTLAHEILWELGMTDPEISTGRWYEWEHRKDEFFRRCREISKRI